MKKIKAVVKKQDAQIVFPRGRGGFTTSLIIAENFQVRHKDVLRKIERLVKKDTKDRLIFTPIFYEDKYKRQQKMYEMGKKAFIILAMRFTSDRALDWQIKFVDQFEFYEDQYKQRRFNHKHIEARHFGKVITKLRADLLNELVPYAIAQAIEAGKVCSYAKSPEICYVNYCRLINSKMFTIIKGLKNPRDHMTTEQLGVVSGAEAIIIKTVREFMPKNVDYHDIYKETRGKMILYADLVGKTNVPQFQIEQKQAKQLKLFQNGGVHAI